jgi:hypothetical protein
MYDVWYKMHELQIHHTSYILYRLILSSHPALLGGGGRITLAGTFHILVAEAIRKR